MSALPKPATPTLADLARTPGKADLVGGRIVAGLTSGRQSFSPDVSSFVGPFPPDHLRFIEGPPTFTVEVRSENDYGPAAGTASSAKRDDSFEVGTLVVQDVDPGAETIAWFRQGLDPALFRRRAGRPRLAAFPR